MTAGRSAGVNPNVSGWAAEYIGLPFRAHGRDRTGLDCYGLLFLVLDEKFGISVPTYAEDYGDPDDRMEISALIRREVFTRWYEVAPGEERAGDAIVLRIAGEPRHVGVVVGRQWMLNVRRGAHTCLERYDSPMWSKRISGFYRYAG
jgi:cell wall-associated NlpC family hydrolase